MAFSAEAGTSRLTSPMDLGLSIVAVSMPDNAILLSRVPILERLTGLV